MVPIFSIFAGGPLGSGKQWFATFSRLTHVLQFLVVLLFEYRILFTVFINSFLLQLPFLLSVEVMCKDGQLVSVSCNGGRIRFLFEFI